MGESVKIVKVPRYTVEMVDIRNCVRGFDRYQSERKSEHACKKCFFFGGDTGSTYYPCTYREYITEATHGEIEKENERSNYWKQFKCAGCGELVQGEVGTHHWSCYHFEYRETYKCEKCGTPHVFIKDIETEYSKDNPDKSWIVMFAVPLSDLIHQEVE